MQDFAGKTAVITGGASGFGREFGRIAASLGMKVVLADIEQGPLEATAQALRADGADVLAERVDVSQASELDRLAAVAFGRFGGVHLLFNNAGVGAGGGLIWESSVKDWEWVLGVNLWGVIHGIRAFLPRMLKQDGPSHVVNTASVAGLICPQTMAVYNTSKHAVVALTETLYQDLKLVGARMGVSVLCPAFVNTGIAQADRNRPAGLQNEAPLTESQRIAREATAKATGAGRLTAADVGRITFEAIREDRFYILTHPRILPSVELRMQDILAQRPPSDPFSFKREVAFKSGAD